ncbi:Abi family protein [Marinospirillum sp.]|uniref:Abi family protein n=1 Tax=Marinospirillum sp. TaxID=2183934 RepID=UPI00287074C7|nr:Abi family protein [Marinospirillum sp.]MDR9467666.1 Abi family protein [Marinospirillum sp.]
MLEDYKKPALTFEQQLLHLKNLGMQIHDSDDALQKLSAISYYRLSGYWFPFRQRDKAGHPSRYFISGTTFEQVLELYEFDRRLRSLMMDAIERVEVAVRTRITYHLGHAYGPFGHTDPANFHPGFDHAAWLRKLEGETVRSSDEFIRHYKERYTGFPKLPVWMLTEVMSFGALSFFYKGLINKRKSGVEDKKAVSDYFHLHHKRLGDWLHTLTYVRNVCAHHSRLWNRELAIRPDKSKQTEWLPPITPRNDRIFYVLLMLRHLLRQSGNGDEWAAEITSLLEPVVKNDAHRKAMGLPDNWKSHPVWK